jgi:hypothetical protein
MDEYSFENSMFNNQNVVVKRDSRKARGKKVNKNSGNFSGSESDNLNEIESKEQYSRSQANIYNKKNPNYPVNKSQQLSSQPINNLTLSNSSTSTMLNNMQLSKPQANNTISTNLLDNAFQSNPTTILQNEQRYICNKKSFIGQFGQTKNPEMQLQKTQNTNFDLDSLLNDPESSALNQLKKKSAGNAKSFKIKK